MKKENTHAGNQALAILFIAMIATGLVLSFVALADFRGRAETPAPVEQTDSDGERFRRVIDGTVTAEIETHLERGFPVRQTAVRVSAALRYLVFRSGNPGVVVGRNGWLFTREEFERYPDDRETMATRLRHIADVQNELANADVRLAVVLVPSKSRVLPEMVPAARQRLAQHPRYENAVAWLRGRQITVVDLLPALKQVEEPFLKRDTHWSPAGVHAAARAIAREVLPAVGTETSAYSYETSKSGQSEVHGDLMNFIPLGKWAAGLGLGPQTVQSTVTTQLSAPPQGLFDLPTIPVTLVGTSFSADERWNFVGELKSALSADVLNISSEAVGPFVPMESYLRGSAYAEVKPQIVIWEIPERYLTLPGLEVPGSKSALE